MQAPQPAANYEKEPACFTVIHVLPSNGICPNAG